MHIRCYLSVSVAIVSVFPECQHSCYIPYTLDHFMITRQMKLLWSAFVPRVRSHDLTLLRLHACVLRRRVSEVILTLSRPRRAWLPAFRASIASLEELRARVRRH